MSRFGGGNRPNLNARECVLGAMGSMCACSEVFFWWYLKAREPLTCGLYCRYRDIDQDIKKDALSVFERFVYKLVQILLNVALKSVQYNAKLAKSGMVRQRKKRFEKNFRCNKK